MTDRTLESASESDSGSSAAQAEGASIENPKAQGKMSSLSKMVGHLLQECPSKQAVYDTLMTACRERLPTSIVRADYVVGTMLLSEIRHDERMAESAAKTFSEKYLAQVSQEVRKSETQEPQFKRFEKSGQQLVIAAAPVVNIKDNVVDGVLTVMIGGAEQRPEVILPILDGIVATASATMLTRALVSSRSRTGSNFRTETTQAGQEHSETAGQPSSAAAMNNLGGAAMATAAMMPNPAAQKVSAEAAAQTAQFAAADGQAAALSRAARFGNLKEFGFTLVNSVSNTFQCEQVAFGTEQNSKVKIHSISGVVDFKPSSPGVDSIRQAMAECLDEEGPISIPQITATAELEAVPSRSIHQQWSVECGNSAICSLPLLDDGKVVAIVSLRRSANRPFTQAEIAKLKAILESYGPAVRVVEKAGQPVGSRISSAMKSKASDSIKKGSWGRRIALACFVLAGAWFCFGSMTYEPLCRSTITAANLRHYSAPFDGQLKTVAVNPGQRVSKGDVLVTFDTSNLKLEMISLQRQISASEVEVKQTISEGELGKASMANARLGVLETEIKAVQQQIQEATIKAPADGVVVLSDLKQRIGQEFPQGEEILQFVVDGDWLLEIEVPDSLVSVVAAQQVGEFAPASDPTNKHAFQIENVDGAASVVEDRNVFRARATFMEQPLDMMTGMEGTSKLSTVEKPVWWVALHGAIDWARINFWL